VRHDRRLQHGQTFTRPELDQHHQASTITGFTMPDHWDEVPAMMQKLAGYLAEGKLKYRAHKLEGLESAIEGINLLFTGGNTGKLMVVL
jgi:NADPH-dependent curcumin reductase CurA